MFFRIVVPAHVYKPILAKGQYIIATGRFIPIVYTGLYLAAESSFIRRLIFDEIKDKDESKGGDLVKIEKDKD